MKSCVVTLSDDLYTIYEEIAKLNGKPLEECLAILLERVIRTMISHAGPDGDA